MKRYAYSIFVLILIVISLPQVSLAAEPGWITSCQYSHSNRDDPIVHPRRPGAAHLHDYTGADSTDAFSTPNSLRSSGTTCQTGGDFSAYWVPALYIAGKRVLPEGTRQNALFYYRRKGVAAGEDVEIIPDGLRMILGNQHATSAAGNKGIQSGNIIFKCGAGSGTDLPYPPTQCDSGIMSISFRFPNCWDGVRLDSSDHISHMAYPSGSKCPASHPVPLPRIESFFRYPIGTAPLGKVTFSSGGYWTAHQDFFNAWEPGALQFLIDTCINADKDCGKNPPVP